MTVISKGTKFKVHESLKKLILLRLRLLREGESAVGAIGPEGKPIKHTLLMEKMSTFKHFYFLLYFLSQVLCLNYIKHTEQVSVWWDYFEKMVLLCPVGSTFGTL